ncbi:MAG TPA: caspase family protein [Cyclobacteriaceae bacterium]|nr:caspase family protein [Cyclobacteriaceae bacterium]
MKNIIVLMFILAALPPAVAQEQNQQKEKINLPTKGEAAYSKDQAFLALSHNDAIHLYAAETFKLSRKLEGHTKPVTSITFSPNGKYLMSTGLDKKIILWDYLKGTRETEITLAEEILGGRMIDDQSAAIITDDKLIVYDFIEKKERFQKKGHMKAVRSLAVSPDAQTIFTGGGDGRVLEYNVTTGEIKRSLNVHKNFVRAIDISQDGKMIASGDDDGITIVSDLEGKVKYTFQQAKGWVRSLKFSMDSKYVASGDDYGTIHINSLEKGVLTEKIAASNVPILSVAFSPDGREVAFVESQRGLRIWSVPTLNISSVFRFRDQKDVTPPQIFISSPANIQDEKIRVFTDIVEVRGTLMDESGIRTLKINGKEIPLKENNNFVMFFPLSMGDNPVQLEARDVNDNVSVKRFTVQRRNADGEQYDVTKAKNYLFVVGINDYVYWPKLNNAVRDAGDITNTLLQAYNFDFTDLTILKNEQATRNNVYNSMRALIEKVTPQDNLLIYFSGHGYFDPILNEGYWIPVEAHTNSVGEYLSNSDLLKVIGNINSQHTFLIADACFSGSLFGETKRGYAENVEKFKSRWGLASGRLEVVSDGEQGKNSPFASAILDFLKDNKRDKLAISELVQAVKIKVAETSNQTPLGNPLKISGDEGGELVLYRKK